jgi:hypothetical protein
LRQLIAGLQSGNPNYDKMTPEVAKVTRERLANLKKGLTQAGAVFTRLWKSVLVTISMSRPTDTV